jgi:ribonucleoside-diphosphate reductase alpha chain|nr:MAG TPA: ribonucleoside-diphosphate reductase, adenosylcobalamin-dependent [Caudoviricetes sp.]
MELQDWKLSELGEDIWKKKYQRNDESFEQWLDRVSGGDKQVAQLIVDKKFLFGGRILSNRGITDRGVTYSNCYVIEPPHDSIEGIYEAAMKLARTFSYGGGCGVDISTLRPKGAEVHNAALTTSGAVSFMDVLEQTARVIGQNGRRGALMISMDSSHPDIHDFIDAKLDNKLEKCNISVRMSDDDMENKPDILDHIALNNYDWAEPGILYWDTIKRYNLLDEFANFEYAGVNPCAEEPLPAGGSCLLGALNLSEFVENPFTDKAAFNIPEFKSAVRIAIRALNDVLDEGLELHPLEEQRESVRDWRQIGLGIMGFADMLLKMGCQYDSSRALDLIDMIGKTLVNTGLEESALLAMDTESFPECDLRLILASTFITVLRNSNVIEDNTIDLIKRYGLRNSQLFTIAPTGSISTMLGVSGGVEPIFATHYTRKTESLHGEDVYYNVYTPIIQKMIDMELIAEENVSTIATAQNIDPFDRVTIQATWQRFIDASISSTVNVTNDTTVETIRDLYQAAWEEGCKGLTIYRAGCKKEGVLVVDTSKEQTMENTIHIPITDTSIDNCVAYGTQLTTGCGSLWMSVYFHKKTGQLCHIFLDKGSTGGCNSFMIGLSRMISYAGKLGGTVEGICDQLNSVPACPSYSVRTALKKDTSAGKCCPSAIGRALMELKQRYIEDHIEMSTGELKREEMTVNNCPECGAKLNFTGGCNSCPECGYTKCD